MTQTQPTTPVPTQVSRPWRSTARTIFQAAVGLAVMLPVLVSAAGLDPASLPWLAGVLAVAAGVTRVMALPQVEVFLARHLPFLAAVPGGARPADSYVGQHRRGDDGHARVSGVGPLIALGLIVVFAFGFLSAF